MEKAERAQLFFRTRHPQNLVEAVYQTHPNLGAGQVSSQSAATFIRYDDGESSGPASAAVLSSRDTAKNLPALKLDGDSEHVTPPTHYKGSKPQGPIFPATLGTCRNIHAEAPATLYGNSRLTFYGSWDFLQFFTDIGQLSASVVRDVQRITSMSTFNTAEVDEALALASGLRTLRISSYTISCVGPAISCVMHFYRAMQPLLERHPSLQRVLSRWLRGHMYRKRRYSFDTPWQGIILTLAADNATTSSEGKPFALGATVAELEGQLKGLSKECGPKSQFGMSR